MTTTSDIKRWRELGRRPVRSTPPKAAGKRALVRAVQAVERPMVRRVVRAREPVAQLREIDRPRSAASAVVDDEVCALCGEAGADKLCETVMVHAGCANQAGPNWWPAAPVAAPVPALAGERDPYEAAGHPWARVGMRVRNIDDWEAFTIGSEYSVLPPRVPHQADANVHLVDDDGDKRWVLSRAFEPAHPAEGEMVEWRPPSDWKLVRKSWRTQWLHVTGAAAWMPDDSPRWYWAAEDQDFASDRDRKDTAAEAMCFALGIAIVRSVDGKTFFATHGATLLVDSGGGLDAEACARAALERHSSHGGAR